VHLTCVPEEEEEKSIVNSVFRDGRKEPLKIVCGPALEEDTYAVYTSRGSATISHLARPHTWYLTLHEQQNVTKP
jgi:hypothetical protein